MRKDAFMGHHTPVMIVGAGPTGLTLACELKRRGVDFRLIEQKQEPIQTSNATWIQPRTLEIFDLMGVIAPVLRRGNVCESLQFYIHGQEVCRLPLQSLPTPYPYALMLSQSETEKILTQHLHQLGGEIERGIQLTGVSVDDAHVLCELKNAEGEIETASCDYLLAADGANSSVRDYCGLHFLGEDIAEQFIVADATIESGLSKKAMHLFFDQGSLFAAFPMGHQEYRITANLHLPYSRKLFTAKEVIEMAQERAHGAYLVKNVEWISPFWIHSKVVKNMQHGSLFLLGDAAHVHSPVGGQGMNTGIQDAFNLGWKLSLVLQGKAPASLLETYHEERYSVIHDVVRETEMMTKMILQEEDFLKKLNEFSASLTEPLPRHIETELHRWTQLAIHYKKSHAIDYENISGDSLQQGTRAPDACLGDEARLYDHWRDGAYHLLVFLDDASTPTKIDMILKMQAEIRAHFAEIKVDVIVKTAVPELPQALLDMDGDAHRVYHANELMIYLVRPDNMIAYVQKTLALSELKQVLKRWLI